MRNIQHTIPVFLKNRVNIIVVVLTLAALYLFIPHFFIRPLGPLQSENYFEASLDPSWIATLNYASKLNMAWGTDFTFTYGPLAYFITRNGWDINKYVLLAYDVFYLFNFCALIFITFRKSSNKWLAALLIVSLLVIVPTFPFGGAAIILFVFLIFWVTMAIRLPRPLYMVMAALLGSLLFFVKFNTGFVALACFYGLVGYTTLFGKLKLWAAAIYVAIPIALILFTAHAVGLNITDYAQSGLELVKGYNETMYYEDGGVYNMLYVAFGIMFLLLVYAYITLKNFPARDNVIIMLISFGALYILYKQAFVRTDLWHSTEFFKYVLLLILASGMLFYRHAAKAPAFIITVVCVACLFTNFKYASYDLTGLQGKIDKSRYFIDFAEYEKDDKVHFMPNENGLPPEILEQIGSSTVDIYPYNAHMLFENGLNYLPRPVMQSYTAYTAYLQELNYNHYTSGNAPQFVLYDYSSIDARYPLFDEPRLQLVFQYNYQIAATFTHMGREVLLLEKRSNAKPVQFKFVKEYAMKLGSPIVPQKDTYYEISVYHGLLGKAKGLLRFAPKMLLAAHTADGQVHDYRTSKTLLEGGVYSGTLITSTTDFEAMLKNVSLGAANNILYYEIKAEKQRYFKEKIRIKEYKIIHYK